MELKAHRTVRARDATPPWVRLPIAPPVDGHLFFPALLPGSRLLSINQDERDAAGLVPLLTQA